MRVTAATGIIVSAMVCATAFSACTSQPRESLTSGAPGVSESPGSSAQTQPPAQAAPSVGADVPNDVLSRLATGVVVRRDANGTTAGAAPIAESAEIERGARSALGAAGGSAQATHDGTPSLRTLPSVQSEVPRARIGWYVNRSIDGFRAAIDQNKPLLLVVAAGWCEYCTNLLYHSLRCPAVERFAGDAVFAYSFVESDKGAFAIAGSLDIQRYPTITVLEPEARMLLERGRINGYFEAGRLGGHVETIIWKTPRRLYEDQPLQAAAPAQRSVLETWIPAPKPTAPATVRDAAAEAQRRGLQHAPPVPQCR